jgi:Flp pilus assembly secretin CpaC
MIRSILTIACLTLSIVPVFAQEGSQAPLEVRLDHASLIRLPQNTATIVVGNPRIADITPQQNGSYVITGRTYGSTNLIAQNDQGEELVTFVLRVLPNFDPGQLTVQRGMKTELLNCLPRCMPAEAVAPQPANTR